MTEKELNQIYYLTKRINRLRERLAELESESGGSGPGGVKASLPSKPTESIAIRRLVLQEDIEEAMAERLEAEIAARRYIAAIPDERLQLAFEDRFIRLMPWVDIAADVSPDWKDIDRTTIAKAVRKYLHENP